MELEKATQLTIQAALTELGSKRYFDICLLNSIAEIVGANKSSPTYKLLSTLHCIDYGKLDPQLLAILPDMVSEVLGSSAPVFYIGEKKTPFPSVVKQEPAKGLLGWLK